MSAKSPRGTKSASKLSATDTESTSSPARRSRRIRGVQAELDVNALEEIEKRNRRSRSRSASITSQTSRAFVTPIASQETSEDCGNTETVSTPSSSERRSFHVDFDHYVSFTEEDIATPKLNKMTPPSVKKSASPKKSSTPAHADSSTQQFLTPVNSKNNTSPKKWLTPNTAEKNSKKSLTPNTAEKDSKKSLTPVNSKNNISPKKWLTPNTAEKNSKKSLTPNTAEKNAKKSLTPVNSKNNISPKKSLTPNTAEKDSKRSLTLNAAEENIDNSEVNVSNTDNIVYPAEEECHVLDSQKLEEQVVAEASLDEIEEDVITNGQDANEELVSEENDDEAEEEIVVSEQDEDEASIGRLDEEEESSDEQEEEETEEQSKKSTPVKNDEKNLQETEEDELDDNDEEDFESMDVDESDEDEDPVKRVQRRNRMYEEDIEDDKTVNQRREKYKKSVVDDRFFCLEEMNAFLDEQDKFDEKRRLGKFDAADEMIGLIERFEEENLRPRTWELAGEVTGEAREKGTLLDNFIDADFQSKSAPTITSDVTENLEAIILKRIKDKLFDDVERKQRRDELVANYRAKTSFDETVRKSLVDVYEEEFLAKQSDEKDTEEYKMDPVVTEIRSDMDSLFKTLDALSHYQFVPPQVKPDVKIVKNIASLQAEEVGPMASTEPTGSLLAPEEVTKHVKAAPKSNEEYDSTDRKRLRRKKKIKQRVMAKKGLTPIDENSELPKMKKTILKKKKKAVLKDKAVKRRKMPTTETNS